MSEPIDFKKEKTKRQKAKAEKGDELKRAELYYQIIGKMNRDPLAPPDWPDFPRTFHYVSDRTGRKAILEELADGIVVYRDRDLVADAILRYCWHDIAYVPGARSIDWESAIKCRNMWLGLTPPLAEQPRVLSEKSQPGLTFKRLPFDAPPSVPASPPPHFEALLDRFSKPAAVCAFIGSLFYPEADRQQYLFLFGHGGDSKGTLMRFLHNIFGDAAQALSLPGKDRDKFWNFSLYGKRLGLFFDTDPSDWFRRAHFKSLTGGDPQFFEEKGRMGFTAMPTVKFIVSSNFMPRLTSSPADMRRLIFVECKPVPEADRQANFENVLMAEAPAIISACKSIYLDTCPNYGAIPTGRRDADDVSGAEDKFIDAFNAHFDVAPDCEIPGTQVRELLRKSGLSDQDIHDCKDVWQRVFGVVAEKRCGKITWRGLGFKSLCGAQQETEGDRAGDRRSPKSLSAYLGR